jgi:hypothetical protein
MEPVKREALPYQDKFFAIEKRLIQGCRSFYADHFSRRPDRGSSGGGGWRWWLYDISLEKCNLKMPFSTLDDKSNEW